MKLLSKSVILAIFAFTTFTLQSQDEGFIYGKLTTIDGDTYTGQIRWGKEEAYWSDIFNGTKEENDNYRYLSRDERDQLRDDRGSRNGWRWSGIRVNWNSDYETTHEFQARFGDLSKIEMRRRSEVLITLRNGEELYIEDGSNDFGADITIMDSEMGQMKFRWSRVDMVEFMETPKKLSAKLGEPLYGTVEFYGGELTGIIQWDHDERLSTDKLDGDTRDGDMAIEFGNLKSIERDRSGSNIVTMSGRELYLRGSNDVNSQNRGIIVTTDFGRVDIPWREFKKVTFSDSPNSGKGYSAYSNMKKLSGTVTTTDGQTLTGDIIYDLDEEFTFEMLQGKDDDVEYIIPMESIKTIAPKNYDNSLVTLKNGTSIMLGESRDVSEDNDGILVFTGSGDPTYVRWDDVKEITFK
jgi:hypothetical protein